MKKILALVLALAMVFALCACGQQAAPAPAASAAPAASEAPAAAGPKTYKVGVAIYQFTDNFMTLYRNEIVDYFKTLETDDVKYEVMTGWNDVANVQGEFTFDQDYITPV